MAILNARAARQLSLLAGKKRQVGASLVEFMLATALSLIALAAVGSVFISGQKLATERSKQLLLTQNLSDTLKYIKEDVKRAGFYNDTGDTLKLVGTEKVIYTTGGLQYVYLNVNDEFETVRLRKNEHKLTLCLQTDSSIPSIDAACSDRYYSLMDDRLVKVTDFNIDKKPLGGTVSSALITVSVSAKLSGATDTISMAAKIKQRNWR